MGASRTRRRRRGPGRASRLVTAALIGIALALLLAPSGARPPSAAARVSLPEGARVHVRDADRVLRRRGLSLAHVDSRGVVVRYRGNAPPRRLQRIAGRAGAAVADALLGGAVTRARARVEQTRTSVGGADATSADQGAGSSAPGGDAAQDPAQVAASDALALAETQARVGAGVVATVDTGSRGRASELRWLALPALALAVLLVVLPGSRRRRRRPVGVDIGGRSPDALLDVVEAAKVSTPAPDDRARPAVEHILDLAELERQLAELEARATARARDDRVRARAAELMGAQPMRTPPSARRNPVAPPRPRRRHHRR